MRFTVTVTHEMVETYMIDANTAVEAMTAWRDAQPIATEELSVSHVDVLRTRS